MSAPAAGRLLEALRGVRRPPAVIVLTSTPRAAWTARARRSGVRAILGADPTAEELSAAIAAAKAGLFVLHPQAVGAAAAPAPAGGAPTTLTAREIEILEMMAEGMSNHAIGVRLKISRNTVKFHVASILAKLAARSRTEAVTVAMRQGLISL
jgi:NarL family two-component system response regulator YdfI